MNIDADLHYGFYKKLPYDKIKINWNKNPIEMSLFLSFLTIEVAISRDHLGSNNGWTKRFNDSCNLIIGGGIIDGKEYLDTLQYKRNLHNAFNDYVSPFFLFEIMNNEGRKYFLEYYKDDINTIKTDLSNHIRVLENKTREALQLQDKIYDELQIITPNPNGKNQDGGS